MTRTLRAPLLALTLAMAMMFAFALPATASSHGGLTQSIISDVTDTVTGDVVGEFVGDVTIDSITRDGDTLTFAGNITGTVTDLAGDSQDVDQAFESTGDVARQGRSCQILALDLGPLDLDLLGLVVNLSDVQLDITAVPGAGNLLGNLLCAVAGLLDGPLLGGVLDTVDRLLDRITGILDGLG
jgi:hypothetical protein